MANENIDKQIEQAEINLAALKKEKEKLIQISLFKKGDYLVCIDIDGMVTEATIKLNQIYIADSDSCTHDCESTIWVTNGDNVAECFWARRFRKATLEEIYNYKVKIYKENREKLYNFVKGEFIIYTGRYNLPNLTVNKVYVTQDNAHPLTRDKLAVKLINDKNVSETVYCYHFRRATAEEVEKYHKDQEELRPKFEVGDRIVYIGAQLPLYGINIYTIMRFDGENKSLVIANQLQSNGINNEYTFGYREIRKATPEEIKNFEEQIIVNNYPAIFDFENNLVKFGCASIHFDQIRNAFNLLHKESTMFGLSNRTIESVNIGKGLFTLEILQKIINRIDHYTDSQTTNTEPKVNFDNPENIQAGDWVTMKDNSWRNNYYKVNSVDGGLLYIQRVGFYACCSIKDLTKIIPINVTITKIS